MNDTVDGLPRLRDAVLAVKAELDFDSALQRVVRATVELTGAEVAEIRLSGEAGRSWSARHPDDGGAGSGGTIDVPITVDERIAGTLAITGPELSDGARALLDAFAALASMSLRNALLHSKTVERERRLESIRALTTSVLEGTQAKSVLRATAHHTRTLVRADLATVAVPHGPDALVIEAADGERASTLEGTVFPLGPSISGEVIRTGEPVVVADVGEDGRAWQPVVRTGGFGPALFVPLASANKPFGTLLVANAAGGRAFTEDDLRVVETVASHVSLAIEYTKTQEQLQRLGLLEERDRIAKGMHEVVIQRVFDVGLSVEQLAMRLTEGSPDVAAQLTGLVDKLDQITREIRTTIFESPPR